MLRPAWHAAYPLPVDRVVRQGLARVRHKDVFDTWAYLDRDLREQVHGLGLWIDSTAQTVEETVDEILSRVWDAAHPEESKDERPPTPAKTEESKS